MKVEAGDNRHARADQFANARKQLAFYGSTPQYRVVLDAHGWSPGLAPVAPGTFGSVVGAGLPLLIKRVGLDPAVSSGPFIASLVDVLGILAYFSIARAILGSLVKMD